MARKFTEPRLLIASHNQGKVREMRDLIAPLGIETVSAAELDLPVPEETGTTFEDNATLKAVAACKATGMVALADDSGLCVDALNGDPGVYTADWAGDPRDFSAAMQRVEDGLRHAGALDAAQRGAHFVAVLALAWPDGHVETFRGQVDGRIVWPPRGDKGFGYDPCFLPHGHHITFGEMARDEKHSWEAGRHDGLSHRARAFAKLWRAALTG